MPDGGSRNILVIRLGALGDFVLSFGPMAAIRAHHRKDRITLLTTDPFRDLADSSGYFDEVWTGGRPRRFTPDWFRLGKRLKKGGFDRVYDLQTSRRSRAYYWMMKPVEWSGNIAGASHPDPNPDRHALHTVERQRGQLAAAGIDAVPAGDVSWITAPVDEFDLSGSYVLIVPGGSAHRPAKRWPADRYLNLCRRLIRSGRTPVLIGGSEDAALLAAISTTDLAIINLVGQTSLEQIAVLARQAEAAIGNDTGPMHLVAMTGCPSLVLFSSSSDPALCAPRPGLQGGAVDILRRRALEALSVDTVMERLEALSGSRDSA
ncbi:MAG: glycosyltransferase family 9 protein [Rhodospirillaceae bacterium]|nr:glycosyltransferase family 9 protein [Rhodospirillaceae bacterium]